MKQKKEKDVGIKAFFFSFVENFCVLFRHLGGLRFGNGRESSVSIDGDGYKTDGILLHKHNHNKVSRCAFRIST